MRRQRIERFAVHNLAPVLVFLVLAMLQGTYYMHAVGPLTMPDPDLHATTSYAVATGQVFNPTVTKTDEHGNPVKVQPLVGDSRYLENENFRNVLVSSLLDEPFTKDKHDALQQGANRETPRTVTIPNAHMRNRSNQYVPIAYLPQGIGLAIGMHTGHSPYDSWQMGRQANLVMFLMLFSLAIMLAPRGKFLLVLIGVIPQTAFISSSLMADASYIGISACFVALVLRFADRGSRLSLIEFAGLTASAVLLFSCKGVYAAEALLALALPAAVLSWRRKGVFAALVAVLAAVPYLVWHARFGGMLARVNVGDNIAFMTRYPIRVLKIILWNICQLPQTIPDLPGVGALAVAAVVGGWILATANAGRTNPPDDLAGWWRSYRYAAIAVIVAVAVLTAIYASLMATWMDMPDLPLTGEVEGFQGRYLLPLAPLLLCSVVVGGRRNETDDAA
ncbi:DUF2142 domain-containing protein [Bifidobacterium sp. MA2]|uniref:DUF2142 domain-containing protein n=1 Tax=Bifidobacterium santillanense TaxID=2809028 RepID=A0ABS5UP42_9BIFI|nr:DUF2142 domain-containing protein [Bifidobacterium santillanense]MBT1172704.1 DUF2142 domain-containing protein [Bifidobacterium santillanense]